MSLAHDLRVAARNLRKSPAFLVAAVAVLGLGIGVNTAIFSLVADVFLAPLPVDAPDRVVEIYSASEHDAAAGGGLLGSLAPISHANFEDLRARARGFAGMAVRSFLPVGLGGGDEPEEITAEMVSPGYFQLLGVDLARGPGFDPDREALGSQPAIVLSHGLWQRRFGGDPAIVGTTLLVNARPLTVTGVAPPGFHGTNALFVGEAWIPVTEWSSLAPPDMARFFDHRRALFFVGLGRLEPGVTVEQARGEVVRVAAELAGEHPDFNGGRSASLLPLSEARIPPNLRPQFVTGAKLLVGAALVVLLVACVDIANLVLTRSAGRGKEMAVRLSLGARRHHLVRQLGLESLLLAALGGAVGLGLAALVMRALVALRPPFLNDAALSPGFDVPVLLAAGGLTLASAFLFALLPALRSARPDLMGVLRDRREASGLGGRLDARRLLVVAQVALSALALVGALLFLRNLESMRRIDPGFDADRLVVASLNPGLHGYDDPAELAALRRGLESDLAGLPGVQTVASAENPPLAFGLLRRVLLPGMSLDEGVLVATNSVSPGYFDTMGIRIESGRGFTTADDAEASPAIVVNRQMAEQLWPGQEAIGRELSFSGEERGLTVIGIAEDARYFALNEEPQPYAYLSLDQRAAATLNVHLRTAGSPEALVEPVRQALARVAPGLPVADLGPGRETLREALWAPRAGASLLGLFGGLAVLLAVVGLYGILASFVVRQRREIGVRLALGAQRGRVTGEVVGQGMRLVAIGLALGLGAAFWLLRSVAGLLFELDPLDLPSFVGATVGLALLALAACWLPARRAARVDPVVALKAG